MRRPGDYWPTNYRFKNRSLDLTATLGPAVYRHSELPKDLRQGSQRVAYEIQGSEGRVLGDVLLQVSQPNAAEVQMLERLELADALRQGGQLVLPDAQLPEGYERADALRQPGLAIIAEL